MYTLLKTIPNHWPDGAAGHELQNAEGATFVIRPEELWHFDLVEGNKRPCAHCKRAVEAHGGRLCTHGPGPRGEFIRPGSSDRAMVRAAAHLSV